MHLILQQPPSVSVHSAGIAALQGEGRRVSGTRGLSVIILPSIYLTLILMGLSLAAEAKVYTVQRRRSAMQSPA